MFWLCCVCLTNGRHYCSRCHYFQTLYQFNHPNIIKLHAYYMTDDLKGDQYLLYEYAEKGSLRSFLVSDSGRERLFSFGQRVKIATDIMTAIHFLHQGNSTIQYCCHRDIKPDNIVLMKDLTAKLTDCGLAKSIPRDCDSTSRLSTAGKGTDAYTCPMYLRGGLEEYKPGCDIYSFGIVLIELWVGRLQNHKAEDSTSNRSGSSSSFSPPSLLFAGNTPLSSSKAFFSCA